MVFQGVNMSLRHLLLGIIFWQPGSGYDIKKTFEQGASFYWNANHSQIYRTLDELFQSGFLEKSEGGGTHPERQEFHITDSGREELLNWLRSPSDLPAFKSPILIKLSWGLLLSRDEALNLLDDYLKKLRKRAEVYRYIRRHILGAPGMDKSIAFFWGLTLANGETYLAGEIRWTRSTMRRIREFYDNTENGPRDGGHNDKP